MKRIFFIFAFIFFSLSSWPAFASLQQAGQDDINPRVLRLALNAYRNAIKQGIRVKNHLLTIIDYSKPSSTKRLAVVDCKKNKILMKTLVAHGKGSGNTVATRFSDTPGTKSSSLGLFVTESTYLGKHGYSLRLKGLEKGFNENAKSRGIVIHSASYVNDDLAKTYGAIGRSWGCPAVDKKIAKPLIDTIKNGSLVFAYYPDNRWLKRSEFLRA